MTGDANFFRKRFLGGFNQQDVVEYVTKLAQERNMYREAKLRAEEEAEKLSGELERVRREAREYKVAALEDAAKALSELEDAFDGVRASIGNAAEIVRAELRNTGDAR
jgi:hypothetical protein